MSAPSTVDEYILAAAPGEQVVLRKLRATIRKAAPEADETISYGMPFYSHPREKGIVGRLCYFSLQRGAVGLFLRPKDLAPHQKAIKKYMRTKSALRFPLDHSIPFPLVDRLVRDAVRRHRKERADQS